MAQRPTRLSALYDDEGEQGYAVRAERYQSTLRVRSRTTPSLLACRAWRCLVAQPSSCFSLNQKVFGIAGTKDRRAITSQRVSAYRVEIQRIKKLKPQLRGIVLSGFGYSDHELKLGDLWGNRFSIVLR